MPTLPSAATSISRQPLHGRPVYSRHNTLRCIMFAPPLALLKQMTIHPLLPIRAPNRGAVKGSGLTPPLPLTQTSLVSRLAALTSIRHTLPAFFFAMTSAKVLRPDVYLAGTNRRVCSLHEAATISNHRAHLRAAGSGQRPDGLLCFV